MKYTIRIFCSIPKDVVLTSRLESIIEKENKVLHFETEDDFYYHVRKFDYIKPSGEKGNHVLESIMTTPNDSQHHKIFFDNSQYRRKQLRCDGTEKYEPDYYCLGYLIKDETGRTIDLRNYENELYRFDYEGYVRTLRKKRELEHIQWRIDYDIASKKYDSLFRVRGKHLLFVRQLYYRRMRTIRDRRYVCDPEQYPFIRGKRRHLPEPWGSELVICHEKSWKSRAKVKRQYLMNKPSHMDTVHYEKKVYDKELLLEYEENDADEVSSSKNYFQ